MTVALGNLRGTPAYAELAIRCRPYSVIFSLTRDLREGGSGTLVRYKSLCGLLTATHVMAGHIDARLIYSPLQRTAIPTVFSNTAVPIQRVIYLETVEGIEAFKGTYWPSGCLDICLLEMEHASFDRILQSSGKQVVDLSAYREKYIANKDGYIASDPISHWSWAVDGSPREDSAHDQQRILHSRFDGLYGCGGSKERTYKTDPLTLVQAPFDRDADRLQHDLGPTLDVLPSKFGGISGGGMWQVSFHGKGGVVKGIAEMFFSGVCVAGLPGKCLYSRGPTALYDIFTAYLDTLIF